MLDETVFKAALKAVFTEQAEELDSNAALDRICTRLAAVIDTQIKTLKINYTGGLIAPNGAVTGTINHTIT